MARILVTQRLVEGGDALLKASGHELRSAEGSRPISRDELLAAVADAEAIVCLLSDRIDAEVIAAAPRLRAIGTVSVGYDHVDLAAARDAGVAVVNTPGVLDDSTADLTIALMLSALRLSTSAEADLRSGRWGGWGLGDHLGRDLSGSAVGLVGYGRIGKAVARRLAAFGCEVRHHSRHDTGLPGWTASLIDLARNSDVLSIHVPGGPDSRRLVDGEVLAALPETAVVVNTARGGVLDEEALADALEGGRLHAAGLDVFKGEPAISPRLLRAPRCTLLPHIGSATIGTRLAMCELASRGVLDVLDGKAPPNLVLA